MQHVTNSTAQDALILNNKLGNRFNNGLSAVNKELGEKAIRVLLSVTAMGGLPVAYSAETNKGGTQKKYADAVGTDSSPNKETNEAIYDSGRGMSVLIWGPVMAAVLGGVVIWMIVGIQKGGVTGAINSGLALVFGGLAMAIVYKYMIAPGATAAD